VIFRVLVGKRTGPFARSSLLLARSMSSEQTFSSEATLREVRVIRILWTFYTQESVELLYQDEMAATYGGLAKVLLWLVVRHLGWLMGGWFENG